MTFPSGEIIVSNSLGTFATGGYGMKGDIGSITVSNNQLFI